MRVWDGLSSRGRVSFDSRPSDGPIAYMTENQNITRGLLAALEQQAPVTVFDKTSVEDIQLGPPPDSSLSSLNLSSYPHVMLSSKQRIGARLLVGADGINGPVRTFAGIPTRGYDYDRHGVVATLKLDMPQDEEVETKAYQRFLPDGPIALLALPDGFATLVWTTTPQKAAHLKTLSSENFIASVNAASRLPIVDIEYMSTQPDGQTSELEWRSSINPANELERTGAVPRTIHSVQEGSIASFSIRLRQATTYTADRIALIGDAAHTIHPLAGQGLNMGLADSQALASAIIEAVEHGADVGNELTCLNKYNGEAWMRNNRMLGVVDKLHWLYSMRNPAVVAARGLGLGMVEQFGGLKNWFMRQAGG
ncbi:MAG: putative ubiquinone biosynthesis monooxygenase [Ramalina farinacea]|uniref:Ubiquinone biosynthesis monooxygenase n=1 Tax=Ramalina farinacea TaxID=258253 RepID=A0AA43TVL8_9LECA|nr:putative ubiquinone biosynthesis monooxygenase [Ramalina farinacea]